MSNIVNTKVKFVRNLKDVNFETNIDKLGKTEVLNLCIDATNACNLKGVPLSDMSESVINNLLAREMLEHEFVYNCDTQGCANEDNITVQINSKNHIEIFAKDISIYDAYAKAKEVDKKLCNKLHFAYSDKYGFLAPDIKNIGSGMSIEVKLMLPALNQLNGIKTLPKSNEKLMFNIKCLDFESGLCLISTGANLGYSEKQVCELTQSYIDKVIKLEEAMSKNIAKDNTDEVLDCCARAKAILNYCIKIEPSEVYALIANILIAINAGLEKDIEFDKINKILDSVKYFNNPKELAINIQKILKTTNNKNN